MAPDSWATALASSVLPVPGGPYRSSPFGTFAPSRWKRFGSRRKSTTSISSERTSSTPATSFQVIWDFARLSTAVGRMRGIIPTVRQRSHAVITRIPKNASGSQVVAKSAA